MDELLESLINQTHDNLEIICITDNPSDIKSDYDLIVKEFDSFKIDDVNGEYVIFAKPSDQFYLVGVESLLDYSLDNDLELLLFSPMDYDVETGEIYEKSSDILNEISRENKKDKFSFDDLSGHAFSLNPEINGIFYKKSFLAECFLDESLSSINSKFLFFKGILNSQCIGIFKNQVYIKKDQSKYRLEASESLNEIYYGVENCSPEEINELCRNISDLFEKSNCHGDCEHNLTNLKMNFYKEILSDNESEMDFEYVKDDLNSNYESSDFNEENALVYKSIMDSNSYGEALLNLKITKSMENIVDTLIRIDFDEIENYDFPADELFGLVVYIDSVPYCFTARFSSKNDGMICFGPGAQQRNNTNSKGQLITPPFFQRWSWHDEFDESVVVYADPTFFYDDDIRIGWFVGEKSKWYLENVALIIDAVSSNRKIEHQNILFYGSSAGGFVSIALATLIEGSKALVNNSQFILLNYEEQHLKRLFSYLKKSFRDSSREEIANLVDYRINLVELFKKQKYIPQISYYVNSDSKSDIHNQCIPFIDEISNLDFFDNDLDIHFYKDIYDIAHTPLSKEKIVPIIKSFFIQKQPNEDNSSQEISKLKNELVKEKKLNKELLSSNSWKLLAPARKLKNVFKK